MPITHEEIEGILDTLFKDDTWAEHSTYPLEDWQYEVVNNDTRQGYRGWLYNKLANEPPVVVTRPYTVLMITPDYLSGAYGHDSYCAWVEAENVEAAQKAGQAEAAAETSDPDDTDPSRPEDFFVVFVCEGHVEDIKIW